MTTWRVVYTFNGKSASVEIEAVNEGTALRRARERLKGEKSIEIISASMVHSKSDPVELPNARI